MLLLGACVNACLSAPGRALYLCGTASGPAPGVAVTAELLAAVRRSRSVGPGDLLLYVYGAEVSGGSD